MEEDDKPEIINHALRQISCTVGHDFEYRTSREIKCKRCPVGYILPPGIILEDGELIEIG